MKAFSSVTMYLSQGERICPRSRTWEYYATH